MGRWYITGKNNNDEKNNIFLHGYYCTYVCHIVLLHQS